MIDYPDDLEGQMTIFDILDEKPTDYTYDRAEKKRPAPKWYPTERCENCETWNRLPTQEQPPYGWGVYGWCNSHKQRVGATGYCDNWEKRKEKKP